MKVKLKCFSSLANEDRCNYREETMYNMREGQTVEDLVQRAGVAGKNVKIAFVNNRSVGLNTVLTDGDQVGLAPAVGGM